MIAKKSILAIDPGPQVCGWVVMQRDGSIDAGVCDTTQLLFSMIEADVMAIERFEARGMPLGDESLQTLIVTGRLMQRWIDDGGGSVIEVRRSAVKRYLCGSNQATDANIRAALIDRYGGKDMAIGRKAAPGPLYGVKAHAWAALAVAVTAAERESALSGKPSPETKVVAGAALDRIDALRDAAQRGERPQPKPKEQI